MEAEPGTPLAGAIRAARAAARRGDVHGVDHAYAEAARISRVIAHDHCAALLALGAIGRAAQRCDEYLTADDTGLRVLRAQIRSAATEHAEAVHDVRELRQRDLTELQRAVLARVAALAAADRSDFPTAESELDAAERHFRRAGHTEHLEAIGNDRLLLDVRRVSQIPKLDDPAPHTPAELLRQATALRRDLRCEAALALMTRCVTSYEIEPALRIAVLLELTALLVLTGQAGTARKLFPLLVADAGPEVLARLPDATRTLRPERHLDHVRRLIAEHRLIEAESLLGEGTSAFWHLTAGELAYAAGRLDQAAEHFRQAFLRTGHAELKALARRKLGDTYADAGQEDQAMRCWPKSHHTDGRVLAAVRRTRRDGKKALAALAIAIASAGCTDQKTAQRELRRTTRWLPRDQVEFKALAQHELGDTYADAGQEDQAMRCWPKSHHTDGRVLAAVRRTRRDGKKALAALAIAIARADCSDPKTAQRELRRTTRRLPRDQVVWMMHATEDQLHHVIIGRKITYIAADVHISELTETTHQLRAWHRGRAPEVLGSLLAELSDRIALEDVVKALPPKVTRIAVVAGDVLADLPLAGLPVLGTRLGLTHALSYLPSLAAIAAGAPAVVADHPADWAWSLHGDRRPRKNGEPVPLQTRPEVFLSFAAKDRPHAEQLCEELEARNVNACLDESGTIPDALAASDYHVLLWSANTPQREWVTEEWTAAFSHEITRRRAFLFIVRLDEEPLPPLLAPRRHIDLVEAADRLVATWRSDRKSELPVFPQPVPPAPTGPTVAISVRSHDLGVTHVVMAPLHLTGAELHRTVFHALRLPAEQATFDGSIGMRFSYELFQQNKPIANDESTVELAADLVDLAVRVESAGPARPYRNREYRPDDELDEGLDVDQKRMLLVAAFRHLLP